MQFTEENFRKLEAESNRLALENRALKQRVDWLLRKMFGSSSEKVDPNQLLMAFGAQTALPDTPEAPLEAEEVTKLRKRRKKVRVMDRLPENLPVVVETMDPEEVQEAPEQYRKISEEVFDQLDITPAKLFIRRTVRNKYVRIAHPELPPMVAPAPKRIIENSYASAGLLLHVLIGKYADHLPLYRQEQIFKTRYGVALDRDTMSRWMVLLSQMLAQIYEAMREELRSKRYLQIDETPVRYLNPGNGKCGKGYLWVYNAPRQSVVFEWHTGRGADCLDEMLNGFTGIVQSDGYTGYESHQKKNPDIELVGCWAHARRKFYEAREESVFAARIVEEIKNLYAVETRLREHPELDGTAVRQAESEPVLSRMRLELLNEQARHLPQSLTRKAIDYALKRWDKLIAYTRHSEVEIDNNLVENAIRPTALGKKNWLFFGSAEAGQTSAIIYSLLVSCKAMDIDIETYLRETFEALPNMTNQTAPEWTPAAWLARQNADS